MATPYNGFDLPVIGADADTWGNKLNTIMTAVDTLLSSPAMTIKGNDTASQIATKDLTPQEAANVVAAVTGATQIADGDRGLAPKPLMTYQNRVFAGDGTWRIGLGRAAGGTITTTNVNGSQPTISGGVNIASISTLTVTGSQSKATVTFTDALPSAVYQIHSSTNGSLTTALTVHDTKTTTSFAIYWDNSGGTNTQIDFSVFGS